MYRIIDKRGTGKTSRLFLLAKETDAVILCANELDLREKAHNYGITGLTFLNYSDSILAPERYEGRKILIDDLEKFAQFMTGFHTIGYTLSED